MNKHYIRLDENNFVIKGFSNAFEEPIETDICINENIGRHFELFGVINAPLFSTNGFPKYKYLNGEILETTDEYADFLETKEIDKLLMPSKSEIIKAEREIEIINLLSELEVL